VSTGVIDEISGGKYTLTPKKIFWITLLFGLLVCGIDLAVDKYVFYKSSTVRGLFFHVPAGELFMRLIIVLSFLVFAILAAATVSKLMAAQQEAENALGFQQQLLNAIPVPVFYKAKDGRYTGCNKAFEEFFGMESEKFIGKTVFEIAPEEIAKVYDDKDQELLNSPGSQIYEFVVKKEDGNNRNVIFHKATFTDINGLVSGLIGAVLDITDRRKIEGEREGLIEKLKKTLDEVEILSGFLPICSSCKKVRDDSGYWNQIESYLQKHSDARFSHGLCPDCEKGLYGKEPWYAEKKRADKKTQPG